MKKLFIKLVFVGLFCCLVFYNVKAENVQLSLNCDKSEVFVLQKITCDVNVENDANVDVNNISFNMEGDGLTLTFSGASGFNNNGTLNGVSLHKDGITSGKIGTLEITALGTISEGTKTISLKNIIITNSEDINIVFNNQDITKKITVLSNKSNNNKLKDLTIDEKTVNGFDATKNEYSITVNTNKVTIGATSDHEKAQIEGVGEKILVVGDNKFDIKVTAENGDVNTYNVTIKYEIPKSDDNTLKSLELYYGDEKIDFVYDVTKTEFKINVEAQVDKISIKSELNDKKASYVKKYEDRDVEVKYGENKFEIRVKAENDQVKSYVLNITREDDRNSNKTLSKLVVNGEEVSLSSSIFEYRVDVRYKYDNSEIIATPTSDKATVNFTNISLVDGENTPVIITVTAENGDKQEYKLVINRLSEAESKVVLKNIIIEGYEFPFDVNTITYDLSLKNNDKSLQITIVPTKDIEYDILNNENLGEGSTVIIRINDDDGKRSYTINIHKDIDKILGIPVDLFCYSIFGLGVVSLVGSIIYVVLVNKKRKN